MSQYTHRGPITIPNQVPSVISEKIYYDGLDLYFNGIIIATGGGGLPTGTLEGTLLGWNGSNWVEQFGVNIIGGSNSQDITNSGSGIFAGNSNLINNGTVQSFIAGGDTNIIGLTASADYSSILGGQNNIIDNTSSSSFIGGGDNNTIDNISGASSIIGGINNTINGGSGTCGILGGQTNIIDTDSDTSCIIGGNANSINDSNNSVILGGGTNTIVATSDWGCILGGSLNNILGANFGVIVGGSGNTIGAISTNCIILGGVSLTTTKTTTCYTSLGQVKRYKLATGASYTLLDSDYIVEIQTGTTTAITLLATPETGRSYKLKKVGALNVTITPAAGNIEGAASYILGGTNTAIEIFYNGTQWLIL